MTQATSSPELSACVVVDYQNIHLTARDVFAPRGVPPEDCLVHPLLFAERVIAVRNMYADDVAQLSAVKVFRGTPTNKHNPFLYGIVQKQRSEWTRDPRVEVKYRSLKYPPRGSTQKPREKGIDVMVALAVVQAAMRHDYDVVILASHDTDMEPAVDLALQERNGVLVETAGWTNSRVLRVPGFCIKHTALNGSEFVATRDRKAYAPPPPT